MASFKLDSLLKTLKSAKGTASAAEESVRVAVYVDGSATPFLVETVREAFVPQTTSALVRVDRLTSDPAPVKDDTDIVLVLTSGSDHLEEAVGSLVPAGAPVAVLAESSVEVPFIRQDTRMLSLICATDKTHLLGQLSRWILDHTKKDLVFAANFPFLRVAASSRVISTCMTTNVATSVLPWSRGADLPAMTVAELDMLFKLAAIYGKPIDADRLYEVAAVVLSALGMRSLSRAVTRDMGRAGRVVKAAIAGAGTCAVGLGLEVLYDHDVDYGPIDAVLGRVWGAVRQGAGAAARAVSGAASARTGA